MLGVPANLSTESSTWMIREINAVQNNDSILMKTSMIHGNNDSHKVEYTEVKLIHSRARKVAVGVVVGIIRVDGVVDRVGVKE